MPFIRFWIDCFLTGWERAGGIINGIGTLAIVVSGFLLVRNLREHRQKWDEGAVKWTFAIFCLAFAISTICIAPFLKFQEADKRKTTQEKLDYIEQNRPQLDATLVVDSVVSNYVICHFDIKNIGKMDATFISEEEMNPNFTSPYFETNNSYLPSDSTMSTINHHIFLSNEQTLDFSLFLKYKGEYQHTNRTYSCNFLFHVLREILNVGKYPHNEGMPYIITSPVHGTNTEQVFYQEYFDRQQGGVSLWFPEVEAGNPFRILLSNTNRLLVIDVVSGNAILECSTGAKKKIVLVQGFETGNSIFHFLVVQWNTNGASLSIDTNSTSDSFP